MSSHTMTLSELATALRGRVNGGWINIRGPGHSGKDHSLGFPAIVALVRDVITGEPVGIHRTALRDDSAWTRCR